MRSSRQVGGGIYSPEWTHRTYEACAERAAQSLLAGRQVIVDANFRELAWRRRFLDMARGLGVRALLLRCQAAPEQVRARLARRHGDASDADWQVYEDSVRQWQEDDPTVAGKLHLLPAGDPQVVHEAAVAALARAGLRERR